MRSWRTPILLTVLGVITLGLAYITTIAPLTSPDLKIADLRAGVDGYTWLLVLQFALLVIIAPILSAGSIAGERERQTLEMLLVTNTGSLRIVLGKLMESFFFLALLVVGLTPISCTLLLYGNVDFQLVGTATLFLLVSLFGALSVGMLSSVLFKRTVTAIIVAYMMIFVIVLITTLPLFFRSGSYRMPKDSNLVLAGSVSLLQSPIPVATWFNPAAGLVALIKVQTGLITDIFRSYMSRSVVMYKWFEQVGFEKFVWVNMACMMGLSIVLLMIASLFVRPRRGSSKWRGRAK